MIYFNHHLFDWRWLVNYCWWMVIDTAAEILSQKKVLNTNFSKQKLSHGIWWNHDLKAVVLSHLPLKEWRLQNQPIVKVNSEQKRNWLIVVRESRKWEGNSQSWEKLNLIHRLPYQGSMEGNSSLLIEEEQDENQHWLLFRSEIEKVGLFYYWQKILQVEDNHIHIHSFGRRNKWSLASHCSNDIRKIISLLNPEVELEVGNLNFYCLC